MNAFDDFVKSNLNNPEFRDKYVAFIDGKFAGVGDKKTELVLRLYDKLSLIHI